jgi:hypothetical protein
MLDNRTKTADCLNARRKWKRKAILNPRNVDYQINIRYQIAGNNRGEKGCHKEKHPHFRRSSQC